MFSNFISKLDSVARTIRPYVPFTTINTVWRLLDKNCYSILDVGCGKGEPMKFINRHGKFHTVGVDIFEPYINLCREQNIHNEYSLCDINNLPFPDKSFDIVLCMEVLEHQEKELGEKLLANFERIACKQIILSTPVGLCEQDEALLNDGNIFQKHKSGWQPSELKQLGYRIRGTTIRFMAGRAGTIACPSKLLRPLGYVLWLLASPLAYVFPNCAADMVCIKKISK